MSIGYLETHVYRVIPSPVITFRLGLRGSVALAIVKMTSQANSSHSPLVLGREQEKGQMYQLKKFISN